MLRAWRQLGVMAALTVGVAEIGSPALGRDTDKSWEVGGFVYFAYYDNSALMKEAIGFGVRGGYHFRAVHEVELDIDTLSTENSDNPDITLDMTKFDLRYVRNFMVKGHEKAVPFAAIGVGQTILESGGESDSSTMYSVGGGAKYYVTPRLALRFEVRPFRWHGDGQIVVGDPIWAYDASIGMSYLFGGETKAP